MQYKQHPRDLPSHRHLLVYKLRNIGNVWGPEQSSASRLLDLLAACEPVEVQKGTKVRRRRDGPIRISTITTGRRQGGDAEAKAQIPIHPGPCGVHLLRLPMMGN
ncbi:hypothetical protein DAPPUDRAFT_233756 [Daphnia pulex]|uniref:Uncharacterized protein n=1 Tax=Daphnia pulex TaxID=6669 RepID=E9FVM5_DAPPU|nr:hypothetical protein DAPPUDRAFT_233756 [Daphnia pulex]|eukprot:EFX88579.1 hypothetical protein DAPPUDRAFT_233756 [Daphnia pulex]